MDCVQRNKFLDALSSTYLSKSGSGESGQIGGAFRDPAFKTFIPTWAIISGAMEDYRDTKYA